MHDFRVGDIVQLVRPLSDDARAGTIYQVYGFEDGWVMLFPDFETQMVGPYCHPSQLDFPIVELIDV